MWDRIARAGRASWALLGIGVVLTVLLFLAWEIRVVFPPLVLAGAIVFLLNPIVTRLHRRGIPRVGGTAICYLTFIGTLVLIGFLITPTISDQATELSEQWPETRTKVEDWINEQSQESKDEDWFIEIPNVQEIEESFGGQEDDTITEFRDKVLEAEAILEDEGEPLLAADLARTSDDVIDRIPSESGFDIAESIEQAREIGTRIFEVGLIFIIGPIIAFYLLIDLPHVRESMESLVPTSAKPEVLHIARRLNVAIGGYFRGQLAVAFIVGCMSSTGLAVIGLKSWLIVGMIAGLFNMVPLIGPYVGAVPGIAIALTTDGGFDQAIGVAIVMIIAQQIDNHFISPLVMKRTTSLHPAAVMLALLVGGTLGGFFGLLLAVPVTASLKVLLGHLWRTYILGEPFEEIVAEDAIADAQPAVGGVTQVGES
jgi:predicted PurR-regulated permease PerM